MRQWRLDAHSTGSRKRRLTSIAPDDESWYYGDIDRDSIQPHGIGAHYTKEGDYIQGGRWEDGELKVPYSQEDYEKLLSGKL